MSIDDQTLMAFADGELQGAARDDVAAAVAADPVLAQRLERFRAVRTLLADPLKAAAPSPPDRLMEAVGRSVMRQATNDRAKFQALAAGLAIVVVGLSVTLISRRPDFQGLESGATARGVLEAALDGAASGQSVRRGARTASPLYTVVAGDGRRCRAFRAVEPGAAYEGAACRAGEAWRLIAIAKVATAPAGFAQASGDEPAAVTAAIDALRPGDPLDPAAERALIAADWKRPGE